MSKIFFEPKPDSPRVTRVSHGEYTWEPQGKPPYQVTAEEWETYIRPTGHFREVKKGVKTDG